MERGDVYLTPGALQQRADSASDMRASTHTHLRRASSSFLFCSARFIRSSFSDLSMALQNVCVIVFLCVAHQA